MLAHSLINSPTRSRTLATTSTFTKYQLTDSLTQMSHSLNHWLI